MDHLNIRVILKPNAVEAGYYAQVLEYDLAADGRCIESTLAELSRVINVHIAAAHDLGVEPFSCLEQAPDYYQKMWEHGKPIVATLPDLKCESFSLPEVELKVA